MPSGYRDRRLRRRETPLRIVFDAAVLVRALREMIGEGNGAAISSVPRPSTAFWRGPYRAMIRPS